MSKFSHLENVEDTARKHPDSFFIPPVEERKSQKKGDSVRLHFHIQNPKEDEPRAERMWVTVTQEMGLFRGYKGELENAPVYIEDLNPGDVITFKASNIAQTIIKKGSPRWIDCGEKKAMASELCFSEGECVRFMYREEPDNDDDSGWRLFSGKESDDYANDPKNIRLPNVGYLVDWDPTLLSPLKNGVGAVFERTEKNQKWTVVKDWSPTTE
jgi:hypothetical protein